MAVRRYTTTLDVPTSKIRTDSGDPVQQENWSPDDKPDLRAQQLSRLQTSVVEATTAARANRHNQAPTFERMYCGANGVAIPLSHRLGRPARWSVVDWVPWVTAAKATTSIAITAASNTTPIVVTVASTTPIANGDVVLITGVLGNTAANGRWIVQGGATTLTLIGSAGSGAYTSGGTITPCSGPVLIRSPNATDVNDNNTLTLLSFTIGVASIEVW